MSEESTNRISHDEWLQMIKEIDANGDRVLSFDEFVRLFSKWYYLLIEYRK